MTATEKGQKRADSIVADAQKQYTKIQDEIEAYKIKQANAAEAMTKAGDACNLDAYNKARDEKTAAEGALEMYGARAEKLEGEPLIDQAEYDQLCDDIRREFDDYIENLRGELFDMTAQLVEKTEAARAKMAAANAALHSLQYDAYRGYDLEYYGQNGQVVKESTVKKVDSREHYEVIHWADSISKTIYDEMRAERQAEPAEVANNAE